MNCSDSSDISNKFSEAETNALENIDGAAPK